MTSSWVCWTSDLNRDSRQEGLMNQIDLFELHEASYFRSAV